MAGITSADVARESGVSRTTVSYVLTGREGVSISEETRRRVLETSKRLGYAPSAAARALKTGRSDLVLCILPDWPIGPVIETLLDHLADEVAERGLSVLVHHARGHRPLQDLWRAVTPRAVIGFAPFDDDDLRAMRQAGIQVLGTQGEAVGPAPSRPSESQIRIGQLQAQQLIASGKHRIAYAWPTDSRVEHFAADRLEGVRRECADHGLPEPEVLSVDLEAASAAAALRTWREGPDPVTGIAAYNDDVALAILAGLRLHGLACPAQVAVVGVDDAPAARLADPPLTTISQSIELQARYLAGLVLAGLGDQAEDEAPTFPGDGMVLVVRGSA
ncbi:LacI family DNA-binding transcriptional regulator [Arthrobacter sp. Sr33]|uniref:LacI family DNA-binding transcriptional regulator n=1 Tax=Arthrobacter sp. TB 23 TaxID=494419 RepID=UPI0002E6D650|nr:LacI family DNA-binding transcriptional regulator [Arthrobacter sp. TB 23]